jgi:hypothetical protein
MKKIEPRFLRRSRQGLERSKFCKENGYVSSAEVGIKYICYGYTDGNKLIVADFEDVKASIGE